MPYVKLLAVATVMFCMNPAAVAKEAPAHPGQLAYPTLDWRPPLGKPFRTRLHNGLQLYIARDTSLPVITIAGHVASGSLLDPPGKKGLAAFTTTMMRTGGTAQFSADDLDALIERLAIKLTIAAHESRIDFSMSFMPEFTDTALIILQQVLFKPAFEKNKIAKERSLLIEQIKHRFDTPSPILSAAYERAMYADAPNAQLTSIESVTSLSIKNMRQFHKRTFKTENMLLAVSGYFDKIKMQQRLEAIFPKARNAGRPEFPDITVRPVAKALIVHKPISQSYVRIGLPWIKRPHPDYYPMSILNTILGGGSFTSRLSSKIRSDEGLTYSIYSSAQSNYTYQGTIFISFFTQMATTSKAIHLSIEEVGKLVAEGFTDKEFEDAKKVLIDGLPSMFRSPQDIVETYAWSEYYGRSEDHFRVYPEKITAITQNQVRKVAEKYLKPDRFTFVVVADTAQLHAQDTLSSFKLSALNNRRVTVPDSLKTVGE
ncbi:MAG: hypothetical protein GF398_12505 [Chitinivibrionales bacterium]|nr:hypothetical protein [Chitinivibrionales bacterium]